MKVIGRTSEHGGDYICTVSHTELEKFFGLYYDKLKRLNIGETVDLGKGYDHAGEIRDALRKTQEFVQGNQKVVTAILNGLRIEAIMRESPDLATVAETSQS